MIIGDMKNWHNEKLGFHPVFHRAIQYIQHTDIKNHELGKFEIEGDYMYTVFMEVDAALPADRIAEHHQTYIDLQYLIDCAEDEIIVTARQSDRNQPVEVCLDDKDYAVYDEVEGEFNIRLRPGMFAVFFADDLHRPCCNESGSGTMRKVVIKINKSLLET